MHQWVWRPHLILHTDQASSAGPSGNAQPAATPARRGRSPEKIVAEGVTFDDVLLLPRYSNVVPSTADTSTRLTPTINLKIPIVSAPMDTVTESALAIALAQEGGIGVIHRNIPPEAQAREVSKVKRSANGIIRDPITLGPDDTVRRARTLMRQYHVSGFPVTEDGGIDLAVRANSWHPHASRSEICRDESTPIREVMTSSGLITGRRRPRSKRRAWCLNKNKVEKLRLSMATSTR